MGSGKSDINDCKCIVKCSTCVSILHTIYEKKSTCCYTRSGLCNGDVYTIFCYHKFFRCDCLCSWLCCSMYYLRYNGEDKYTAENFFINNYVFAFVDINGTGNLTMELNMFCDIFES